MALTPPTAPKHPLPLQRLQYETWKSMTKGNLGGKIFRLLALFCIC